MQLGRIQNFGSWSPYMVQDGRTCLGLEYFVNEGDELWTMADDELVASRTDELAALGLVDPVDGRGRLRRADAEGLPRLRRHYAANVDTIRGWLAEHAANVHPVGRNGMHRYNNQDHSMLTAMLAVENILDGAGHDIWAVNVEEEYHEEARPRRPTPSAPAPGPGRAAPIFA